MNDKSTPIFGIWQSAETAPKDGTHVIVAVDAALRGSPIIGSAYFDPKAYDGTWWWSGTAIADHFSSSIEDGNDGPPTHWMPVPPPPVHTATYEHVTSADSGTQATAQADPVAWLCEDLILPEDAPRITRVRSRAEGWAAMMFKGKPAWRVTPLYAAPQVAAQAVPVALDPDGGSMGFPIDVQPVPDGWVLVPVEPTPGIRARMESRGIDFGIDFDERGGDEAIDALYRSAIAARPTPAAPAVTDDLPVAKRIAWARHKTIMGERGDSDAEVYWKFLTENCPREVEAFLAAARAARGEDL